MKRALIVAALTISVAWAAWADARERIVIGSKAFPESWILGDALAQLARASGLDAEHRVNLGGTEIVDAALRAGAIDAYPEYTGTLREVVVHAPEASLDELRARLASSGLGVTGPLGFDDSYALAVPRPIVERDALRRISDLAGHPELRAAFSHEFLGRTDGWPGLRTRYGLSLAAVRGVEHPLAFDALASGRAEVIDVYTTDPQIDRLDLRLLDDDRNFFPRYDAVIVYRLDLEARAPAALQAMRRLVGRVDRATMTRANAAVAFEARTADDAAASLLLDALGPTSPAGPTQIARESTTGLVARDLLRHLRLVIVSLLAAVLAGIPLGLLAGRRPRLAALVLGGAGVLQTIPALALLAILIPLLGIGVLPATTALFLYALLPIVQGTCTGLVGIPAALAEAAEALGLSARAKLLYIELPLASPSILAGVRTSAVITVGTATIAALVGAGGLGDPILEGIAVRSATLILAGALPCAALALAVQGAFGLLERALVPRGLQLRTHVE